MKKYISKPGDNGTLYRYFIVYSGSKGSLKFRWRTWAYNCEHAWENWQDANATEGGHWKTHGTFRREQKPA